MSTSPLLDDTEVLREHRRALRAEMNRVQHWRRLLRARMDLSISAALLPDRLGLVPVSALVGVAPPDHVRMATLVRGDVPTSAVLDLGELRDLEAEVQEYGRQVRSQLERVTERLVQRLTDDLTGASASLSPLF